MKPTTHKDKTGSECKMFKRKMASSGDQANNNNNTNGSPISTKTKRQKLNNSTATTTNEKRQQAAVARKQTASNQQVSTTQARAQEAEPVWIYGLINNIEQMLSEFNAANNSQRLQQVVQQQQLQQQQLISGGSYGKPPSTSKPGRTGAKSRSSTNSSGYSTPSSLYSSASSSPPFSSSSAANCAYSSSSSSNSPISAPGMGQCQSPKQYITQVKQQMTATTMTTTTPTKTQANSNKTSQQQQQQQLPRSPLSRQIKFHEYKGPPQTRRPNNNNNNNQHKPHQQAAPVAANQDKTVRVEQPGVVKQLIVATNCAVMQQQQANNAPMQRIKASSMEPSCQQHQLAAGVPLNPVRNDAVFAPMLVASNQTQYRPPTTNAPHQEPMPSFQPDNGRLVMGPMAESIDRRGQVVIVSQQHAQAPESLDVGHQASQQQSFAFAADSSQPSRQAHLSLQLIRRSNGQQQQVLVVDPIAFQQMQQQQFNYQQQFDQKPNNIIVLQHEPLAQLAPNNNNSINHCDDFQMHQMQTQANTFANQGNYLDQDNRALNVTANDDLYYRSAHQAVPRTTPSITTSVRLQERQQQQQQLPQQSFGGCQEGPINGGTSMLTSMPQADYIDHNGDHQFGHHQQANPNDNQVQYYQSQEVFGGGGVIVDNHHHNHQLEEEEDDDDTCEIEPTISFEGELDHRLMYSEFIDSQDIPLNVDESDWLKKFLPPCSSA